MSLLLASLPQFSEEVKPWLRWPPTPLHFLKALVAFVTASPSVPSPSWGRRSPVWGARGCIPLVGHIPGTLYLLGDYFLNQWAGVVDIFQIRVLKLLQQNTSELVRTCEDLLLLYIHCPVYCSLFSPAQALKWPFREADGICGQSAWVHSCSASYQLWDFQQGS